MPAAAHKLAISFGLVYIPINLYKAISEDRVSFNQIHAVSGKRVRYKKVIEGTDTEVRGAEIVKGFEFEKGKYVTFTDEEIESMRTTKDKTITIERFVPMGSIDPVYYDECYYSEPNGGDKAYALLNRAMLQENCIGIGKAVLRTRERLFAVTPMEAGISIQTLHFEPEVRVSPAARPANVDDKELDMGRMIVKAMAKDFDPSAYRDESEEKIKAAVQAKINNQDITAPADDIPQNIVSLQEMLEKNLEMAKHRDSQPDFAGVHR